MTDRTRARALARRGFEVTAFDISPTAIGKCRERFSDSTVLYEVADLLQPPVRRFWVEYRRDPCQEASRRTRGLKSRRGTHGS